MRSISLSVSSSEYEEFRALAEARGQSIAHLIREAMTHYRATVLAVRAPLRDLPVVVGPRPLGPLPGRAELYDEIFSPAGRANEVRPAWPQGPQEPLGRDGDDVTSAKPSGPTGGRR